MKHKPGTKKAIEAGCVCPVVDNHYGAGVPSNTGEQLYWYSGECKYHKENN